MTEQGFWHRIHGHRTHNIILLFLENYVVLHGGKKKDGSVFKGPYPADKVSPVAADYLTFSESASDPKNASPRWTLSTVAKISFDRFCVSFAMFGKISVYPYHS